MVVAQEGKEVWVVATTVVTWEEAEGAVMVEEVREVEVDQEVLRSTPH